MVRLESMKLCATRQQLQKHFNVILHKDIKTFNGSEFLISVSDLP